MEKYLCVLKKIYNFPNIYPEYIIKENILEKVDKNILCPTRGNIFAEFARNYDNYFNDDIFILSFNSDELLNYRRADNSLYETEKKIDFRMLVENDRVIKNTFNEKIYKLIDLNDLPMAVNLDKDEIIEIKDVSSINKYKLSTEEKNELVYIKGNNYIYGPYVFVTKDYKIFFVPEKNFEVERRRIDYKYIHQIPMSSIEIFFLNENEPSEKIIDVMSDETALKRYKNFIETEIGIKGTYSVKEIIDTLDKLYETSHLSKKQADNLKNKIENYKTHTKINDEIIDILKYLILNDKNNNSEVISESIASKIIENPDLKRKLQNIKLVLDEIEKLNNSKNEITQDIEKERTELQNLKNEKDELNYEELKGKQHSQLDSEIDLKKNKLNEINENIYKQLEKLELTDDISKLKKEYEYQSRRNRDREKEAEASIEKLEKEKEKKEVELKNLDNEISEAMKKVFDKNMEKYPQIAFDGIIASKMLEAAAEYEKTNIKQDYEKAVEILHNKLDNYIFKDNDIDLKNYIISNIKEHRPEYSDNDIINCMICLTQGFLTIFAGEPGVGKTSICNIISNVFGLNVPSAKYKYDVDSHETSKLPEENINVYFKRYIEVSVERGWTSKRDFVGYYNPLTKNFDKNNSALFSAFNILDIEERHSQEKFPFFILLDEANLSSMEHYWSDFMDICDLDKIQERNINLGENYVFNIPPTLKFLGTINYDHTTEPLSSRIIDRAWIIMLPFYTEYNESKKSKDGFNPEKIITFDQLQSLFNIEIENTADIDEKLNEIYSYELFKKKIQISNRTKNMIKKYVYTGQMLFEETNNTKNKIYIALDYAVSQKLLPKIDGYGEDYKKYLDEFLKYCNDNDMMNSEKLLERIIDNGENNNQYYQFFC